MRLCSILAGQQSSSLVTDDTTVVHFDDDKQPVGGAWLFEPIFNLGFFFIRAKPNKSFHV
jgi:hypothetical protein